METTVSCFEEHAKLYDAYQSAVIPQYDFSLGMILKVLKRYMSGPIRVLDLGCGTGNLSKVILSDMPSAKAFLLDGSESSLAIAEQKLGAIAAGRVLGSAVRDLNDSGWDAPLSGLKFDAIVSSFVLEHLPEKRYIAVIRKCHALLKRGGRLVTVEGYDQKGANFYDWIKEDIREKEESVSDEAMIKFVSDLRKKKERHHFLPMERKRRLWLRCGFKNAHFVYQYLCIGLLIGRRG